LLPFPPSGPDGFGLQCSFCAFFLSPACSTVNLFNSYVLYFYISVICFEFGYPQQLICTERFVYKQPIMCRAAYKLYFSYTVIHYDLTHTGLTNINELLL